MSNEQQTQPVSTTNTTTGLPSTEIFNYNNQDRMFLVHDALSDHIVAPYGRLAGLRTQQLGISTYRNQRSVDKNADRIKLQEKVKEYFRKSYKDCTIAVIEEHDVEGSLSFQLAINDAHKDTVAIVFFRDNGRTNHSDIRVVGFHREVVIEAINYLEEFRPLKQFTITRVDIAGQDIKQISYTVEENDAKTYDEFYPFIEEGASNLLKGFYASKSNLLMFIGEWGTGKSSLVRSLLNYTKSNVYLIDNLDIYNDPNKFAAVSAMLMEAAAEEPITIILEEADSILGKKSAENTALSRLLSMSDGVVNSNMKFVICANVESISKIDPSLTRPGRSYRTIVFERLNPDQANESRACFGKPAVQFNGQVTLATALNATQEEDEDFGKRAPMGFVGTTR
jgi:hypothetical protein